MVDKQKNQPVRARCATSSGLQEKHIQYGPREKLSSRHLKFGVMGVES